MDANDVIAIIKRRQAKFRAQRRSGPQEDFDKAAIVIADEYDILLAEIEVAANQPEAERKNKQAESEIDRGQSGTNERRRNRRKRSDPSAVRVRLKDQAGGSRWVTAYLNEVTEGGASIALMTQLEIGSRVAIQGNLGEGRADVPIDADVKWCTRGNGGVFNVGLKLVGKSSEDTL